MGVNAEELQGARADLLERFGANLRYERELEGWSQEYLSELAGIHRTEVSLLERGGRAPNLLTILVLSGALGVSPASLLDGMEWEPFRSPACPEPRDGFVSTE